MNTIICIAYCYRNKSISNNYLPCFFFIRQHEYQRQSSKDFMAHLHYTTININNNSGNMWLGCKKVDIANALQISTVVCD